MFHLLRYKDLRVGASCAFTEPGRFGVGFSLDGTAHMMGDFLRVVSIEVLNGEILVAVSGQSSGAKVTEVQTTVQARLLRATTSLPNFAPGDEVTFVQRGEPKQGRVASILGAGPGTWFYSIATATSMAECYEHLMLPAPSALFVTE